MRIAHRRSTGDMPQTFRSTDDMPVAFRSTNDTPQNIPESKRYVSQNYNNENVPSNDDTGHSRSSNFIYETPFISGTPYDENQKNKSSKYGDEGFS